MKRNIFSTRCSTVLWLLLLVFGQCTLYEPTVAIKVVNQKDPTQVVPGAKVSLPGNGPAEVTDNEGLVFLEIDLDRFILDRVQISVSAQQLGYIDTLTSILVGKDQQETIVVPMKPRNRLKYVPDSVVIKANEVFKEVKIVNEGLDPIKVSYSDNNQSWMDLMSVDSIIKPDQDGYLKVSTAITQQHCRVDGLVYVDWVNNGQAKRDTLPVTKIVKDDEAPFPSFNMKQNGVTVFNQVYQNKEVTFDAGASTDNCEAFTPLEYEWDFGDNNPTGFSSTHQVYKYTFIQLSTPTVILRVRDGSGLVGTKTLDISVILEPSAPVIDMAMSATEGGGLLSVSLNARILNFGATYESLTDYGFVYSTVVDLPVYGSNPPPISFGPVGPTPLAFQQFTFEKTISGLQPKRYYFRAYAKNSGFPYVYSDPVVYDVVLARFVPVGGNPGGQSQAQRGDNNSTFADQKPQSTIAYNNFEMTETEVTNAQYAAFLNDGPTSPAQASNFIAMYINNPACKISYNGNSYQVIAGEENKPVVTVTYEGAKAFCTFVQGRLPTEAEWEAAARANATGVYPQWAGTNTAPPENHAVFNATQPANVKTKTKNGYDLYDMSGNIAEWCQDWYDQYSLQNTVNPQGPLSSPTGERVIRGGSFQDGSEQITVTYRGKLSPIAQSPRVGFRVVKN